jgi:hypothetical protein
MNTLFFMKKNFTGMLGKINLTSIFAFPKGKIARSSNGRTTDFGSVCGGSNPSRATHKNVECWI